MKDHAIHEIYTDPSGHLRVRLIDGRCIRGDSIDELEKVILTDVHSHRAGTTEGTGRLSTPYHDPTGDKAVRDLERQGWDPNNTAHTRFKK